MLPRRMGFRLLHHLFHLGGRKSETAPEGGLNHVAPTTHQPLLGSEGGTSTKEGI
jgi:hypothetical protein